MWHSLFLTLAVAVSTVLGQSEGPCTQLLVGRTSLYAVPYKQLLLNENQLLTLTAVNQCSAGRMSGLLTIACNVDYYPKLPPVLTRTGAVNEVVIQTNAQTAVNMVGYCELPTELNNRLKISSHRVKESEGNNLKY